MNAVTVWEPVLRFAIVLLFVPLLRVFLQFFTLRGTSDERLQRWRTFCRTNHIVALLTVVVWCGLHELFISTSQLVFWLMPICAALLTLLCAGLIGRRLSRRHWTTTDLIRLAFWNTVCPIISLLMLASGVHEMLEINLLGLVWFPVAAMTAVVGIIRLRDAQGMKLRRVKSGTLFNRVMHLSKRVGMKIERVYVVPSGRGQLTNAFASSRSVALTDNFGEYLSGVELDAVIAHELGHVRDRHTRKKLLLLAVIVSSISLLALVIGSASPSVRAIFVICALFILLLSHYYISRRFEYECDRNAAQLINPGGIIRGLTALYRKTNSPTTSSRFVEIFSTHPSLINRIRSIANFSDMPESQFNEYLSRCAPAVREEDMALP